MQRDREVSWLLTGSSLDCKKNIIGEDFSGLEKKESSSRDSRDREVSWLLTSSFLEARTGLTQRTPGEKYLVAPSPTLGRNLERTGPIQAAFSPPK
jgi:hypothetical protein